MSMTDPIADLLTRIRNGAPGAQGARRHAVVAASRKRIARVLVDEGYLRDVAASSSEGAAKHAAHRAHATTTRPRPVINGIKRVSRPSRRVYVGANEIPRVRERPRHHHPLDPARRPDRPRGARSATSAASCSARSGRSDACRASEACRSRFPRASRCTSRTGRVRVEGPEGQARRATLPPEVDARGRGRHGATSTRATTSRAARAASTASRARSSPTWSTGVSEGLHARARDPASATAPRRKGNDAAPDPRLLAPDRLSSCPQGVTAKVEQAGRRSRSRAPTASCSARPPRRSASCGRPSRTRARASSTPRRRSAGRPARPPARQEAR